MNFDFEMRSNSFDVNKFACILFHVNSEKLFINCLSTKNFELSRKTVATTLD